MLKRKENVYILFLGLWYLYFCFLEKSVTTFVSTNIFIDDYIPFIPSFIIPYLLWFVYVFIAYVYFYRNDRESFIKMAKFISIGMTIFLFICTFFPNGLSNFRITIQQPQNIVETLTHYMQLSDTSTNVFPSIHVYNSLGVHIAILKYSGFKHKKMVHIGSTILCVCICLSTLFLKQHSLIDVFASLILALAIYYFVYR